MNPTLPAASAAANNPILALAGFADLAPLARPRQRAFLGQAIQASHARQFARDCLGQCPATSDAALLLSELVSNSIRHSRSADSGTIHVLIAHHCPGNIRIAVIDDRAPTTPNPATPGHHDDSGRASCSSRPSQPAGGTTETITPAPYGSRSNADDQAIRRA